MNIGSAEEAVIFEIVKLKLEVASPFQSYFDGLLDIKQTHLQINSDDFLYLSEICRILFDLLPRVTEEKISMASFRKSLRSDKIDLSEALLQKILDLNQKNIENFILNR